MVAVKGLTGVVAALGLAMVGVSCSSGAVQRTGTAVAVKAVLHDHDIDYRGDVRCVGNQLPIACTSMTTDGAPISATLSRSNGQCELVVVVGSREISRNRADCPDP
jgi:hypothetical protein